MYTLWSILEYEWHEFDTLTYIDTWSFWSYSAVIAGCPTFRSVRVAERLALPTSDHGVAGSNPAGSEILPEPKWRFIAQSLSCSPFRRLEMTEILLKGRKTLTHPSMSHIYTASLHNWFINQMLQCHLFSSGLNRSKMTSAKWHVHPAKTQISLGIRPVWSESSLSAWRKLRSLAIHRADSEDSDQTGHTVILLVLSWGGSFVRVWKSSV